MYSVDSKNGPSEEQTEELNCWKEEGYICGNECSVNIFKLRRQLRCGGFIEAQYYEPQLIIGSRKKGSSLSTDLICCLCYGDSDVVSMKALKKKMHNYGGCNHLSAKSVLMV